MASTTMPTHPPTESNRAAPLYGAAAVFALPLSFTTMYEQTHADGVTSTYGSLWDMAARTGGGPAAIGILLMVALISCCVAATLLRFSSPGLPIAVGVLGLIAMLMVLTKPGTGDPKPPVADGGAMMASLGFVLAAIGFVHAARLLASRRARPDADD